MSRTISPSSRKPYGLALVCRVWAASRATVYRHRVPPWAGSPRRPGPVGSMPDAALLQAIRAILAASPFHGEGHRKVWARLRVVGTGFVYKSAAPSQYLARDGANREAPGAAADARE